MVGVARLRDMIVPVVDLGFRFGFRKMASPSKGAIIMVNVPTGVIGLLVDSLEGTLDIKEDIFYDLPLMFDARESEYMVGVVRLDFRLITILDVAKLLEKSEVKELKELQEL